MQRRYARIACGAILVVSGWGAQQVSHPLPAVALECDQVLNIGHRGAGEGPNENTIEHLARAARQGVDIVEFDVRRTRDGVLGIMHDRTVNRTTNGRGRVARMSWRRFHGLETAAGYHPPSLGAVIRAMAPLGVGLQIHLQVGISAGRLSGIARTLESNGFGPEIVQFNSASLRQLQRVRRVTGFPTGFTYIGRPTRTRLSRVARSGADVAVIHRRYVRASWVSFTASRGLELGARAWTIDPDWAVRLGVRRLVVDRPQFDCGLVSG